MAVPGEIYCRFSQDGGITLCQDVCMSLPQRFTCYPNTTQKHKWSSMSALKKHFRDTHGMESAPQSRNGSLSSREDQFAGRKS